MWEVSREEGPRSNACQGCGLGRLPLRRRPHLLPAYVFFTTRIWRLRFGREVGLWPFAVAIVARGA